MTARSKLRALALAASLIFVHAAVATDGVDHDLNCLARVVYHEARGEPLKGKLAVAQAALNRTQHPEFPDTVCGVIQQPRAFPWYKKKTPVHRVEFEESYKLAKKILTWHRNGEEWGPAKTRNSLFFNTVPFSYNRLKFDAQIGNHLFYSVKK